jgi:pyruvate dehydrogenase E1 component alpha subunit
MFAELYGKDTGCARGKGGSMHLIGMDQYILGTSAVVGTTIPMAVGYALALKREGKGRVAVSFFGDGATEEGVFYESLNFASLHKLPVLFVCENNFYAIHTPISKRWATCNLCDRIRSYDIPAEQVSDSNVFQIRRLAAEAIAPMRTGQAGPAFLECHTYRWREHVGPGEDYQSGYRTRDELSPWQERDQVAIVERMLDDVTRARIDDEIEETIARAIDFAERSPFPNAQELFTHVYAS